MNKFKGIILAGFLMTGVMIGCSGDEACAAPGSGTGGFRSPPPVRVSPPPVRTYTPAPRTYTTPKSPTYKSSPAPRSAPVVVPAPVIIDGSPNDNKNSENEC